MVAMPHEDTGELRKNTKGQQGVGGTAERAHAFSKVVCDGLDFTQSSGPDDRHALYVGHFVQVLPGNTTRRCRCVFVPISGFFLLALWAPTICGS
jgi:hypothetical protein